jgi:hypothetical protein
MIVLYFVLACVYCLGVGGMFMFCYFTDVLTYNGNVLEQGQNKVIYAFVALIWPLMALGWLMVEMPKKVIAYLESGKPVLGPPNKTPPQP